jgi:hypothetical protein
MRCAKNSIGRKRFEVRWYQLNSQWIGDERVACGQLEIQDSKLWEEENKKYRMLLLDEKEAWSVKQQALPTECWFPL